MTGFLQGRSVHLVVDWLVVMAASPQLDMEDSLKWI